MSAPLHAHSVTHARRASGGRRRRRRRVRSLPPRTCSSAAPKSVRPSLTLNTTASLISQQPVGGRKWSFSCLRFCCCCCFNFLLLVVVEATLSLRTVITACLSFSLFPPSVRFPSCMETENPLVLLSPPSDLRGAVSRSVALRRAGRKDLPEYIQRKICFQHVCSIVVGIMS